MRHFLIAVLIPISALAQSKPAELARTVADCWTGTSEQAFRGVYPFREGRSDFANASRGQADRSAGLSSVVRSDAGRAVLLLSGVPEGGNSGDETRGASGYSGMYEARPQNGLWKLTARIPLEEIGQIKAQDLTVAVRPASGIEVTDRLSIHVLGNNGFSARLNHRAKLDAVTIGGRPARHLFGGGLLWVDASPGDVELKLKYSIEVEEGPNDSNSSAFLRKAGHIRNQYLWHPLFDFHSTGDQADFHIEIHIPKEYRVSTSLPQSERVEGNERIVVGETLRPTFALTLVYDRDWRRAGAVRVFAFESFDQVRELRCNRSGLAAV